MWPLIFSTDWFSVVYSTDLAAVNEQQISVLGMWKWSPEFESQSCFCVSLLDCFLLNASVSEYNDEF